MSLFRSHLPDLEAAARAATETSYAPYSRFPVGAAVLVGAGSIFRGGNIENASFGLTCCAERVAVFAALAAGHRTLVGVVIYTPTPEPTTPCGACRQVLHELGGNDVPVVCVCEGPRRLETTVGALLPEPFSPGPLSGGLP